MTESDGYKFRWFYNLGNKEVNALALLFPSRKYDCLDDSSNLMSLMKFVDKDLTFSSSLEALYFSFLYKEIDIPNEISSGNSNLQDLLLRNRYLDCCQFVLGKSSISYIDLYQSFVIESSDLILAQELDVAVILAYRRKMMPMLFLRVLEGGLFVQALNACVVSGSLNNEELALALKNFYMNRMFKLVNCIQPRH
ncbi:hypothetical protein [Brasilonema sp. UFV-L1]|uniref:hypothetical protein n=1 Tax=Brasilonema sp. UFV-L1 TaxID=2234130 RepID=UPI00145CD633|nr:hypothetical protein [Brasilonema sp. UFV-L1]